MGLSVVPDNNQCPRLACQAPPYLGYDANGQPLCPVSNMLQLPSALISRDTHPFGDVYGCLSDCALYSGEKYCCPPGASGRDTCHGANPFFKAVCPQAYTYASDDTSDVSCLSATNFTIIFSCP